MEMEFSSAHFHPSLAAQLVVLFCLFWPFVAVSLMAGRARSAAPVAAALAPLAVSGIGAWLGLADVAWARAITGGGRASSAAGVAESLMMFFLGAFFALVVIVFAAFRRHRPIVDRMSAALVTLFLASWIGALISGAALIERTVPEAFPFAGAIVAGAVALAAIVWTFLTGRGRVSSAALPYGVPVAAILTTIMAVIVWELAHKYIDIALGR